MAGLNGFWSLQPFWGDLGVLVGGKWVNIKNIPSTITLMTAKNSEKNAKKGQKIVFFIPSKELILRK
ncbi:hypothetical protein A5482_015015 (plasmid) [Cyanobacterium sp. IPPAS B-1200]|uniref:hypothetical protein n=1 Tax=Cyanobacterium sp. IPPAS B-1200 TaxID=1562720 RepID=UPI00085280F7|nr:hypothetical protein [Cyanobacterium sp. IPPAS B-1200]OEJ77877.1 hypothetical protein A5482_14720 [Cyanobacterium sp. IPPAS B-1200]